MTTLLAYHADPALKEATLAHMRAHREADRIVQRQYWERGKGCAVGCLTHDPNGGHHLYPERWGIPEVLARLEDRIFEGLSPEEAQLWPERFLSAIPVGADLSGVWPRFAHALLVDPAHGVARLCPEGSDQRVAVERVAGLFERLIRGEVVRVGEWLALPDAAAAAAAAAVAAAYAAAYAAYAYADAAYAYAADVAAAYAAAYAADDAPRGHWTWCAETLCQLLREAPRAAAA